MGFVVSDLVNNLVLFANVVTVAKPAKGKENILVNIVFILNFVKYVGKNKYTHNGTTRVATGDLHVPVTLYC